MTNKHDRNYNLMEYFLNLLPILELNDMGMEQLLERGAQLSAASLPDATNLWIAHELMQFMDEMPGGFLFTVLTERGDHLCQQGSAAHFSVQKSPGFSDVDEQFLPWPGPP